MPITFREISLRQVVEADLTFLFGLFTNPGRCHLWLRARPVYSEADFQQAWGAWTSGAMAAKFIVEAAGRPVGLVFDYDRVVEDGHTKVTALLDEASTGHGIGPIATVLFWAWLFQGLPLRKVYMDVFGYNPAVVRMLRKVGLAEEGVLKGDRYWDGAYWDLHVFALYREALPRVRDRVLRVPGTRRPSAAPRSARPAMEVNPGDLRASSNGYLGGADQELGPRRLDP
jgi:RimJ/RimL family protein N-acetyltransferase